MKTTKCLARMNIRLSEEVIAIVKASPRRYFAPIIGAIAAVRAEWSRVKRQA